jgi:3-hydroxyisobutyrate dehydrogenase-like beta-hydroxyacid dehydrogenase
MNEPVGLIGLGLLGTALGERLLARGFGIVGCDTDPDALERFRSLGGQPADCLLDLARHCRRILLSLPTSEVSRSVTRELVPHCSANTTVIDTTTGDPEEMEEIAKELHDAGVNYLDATVAGSSAQARTGSVLMLIGGNKAHVAACRDIFDALSSRALHVGPPGSGARMKLVVNLVLGLNRAVLAEGLSFAKSQGFDPATALDVLSRSPAASTVMETKGEKMVTGDFTPQARLRQHLKDVRLILKAAQGAPTPLSELHAALLQSLVDQGHGDEDNSAIVRAFGIGRRR